MAHIIGPFKRIAQCLSSWL